MKLSTAEEKKMCEWKIGVKKHAEYILLESTERQDAKRNHCQPKIVNLTKIFFNKNKINTFSN